MRYKFVKLVGVCLLTTLLSSCASLGDKSSNIINENEHTDDQKEKTNKKQVPDVFIELTDGQLSPMETFRYEILIDNWESHSFIMKKHNRRVYEFKSLNKEEQTFSGIFGSDHIYQNRDLYIIEVETKEEKEREREDTNKKSHSYMWDSKDNLLHQSNDVSLEMSEADFLDKSFGLSINTTELWNMLLALGDAKSIDIWAYSGQPRRITLGDYECYYQYENATSKIPSAVMVKYKGDIRVIFSMKEFSGYMPQEQNPSWPFMDDWKRVFTKNW